MDAMHNLFGKQFLDDERGVTAIEYGLVAALIAVFCVGAFTAYGAALANLYQSWVVPALSAL